MTTTTQHLDKTAAIAEGTSRPEVMVFCDGSGGLGATHKGSGYAWFRTDTGEKFVEYQDGLTNNQAEYNAIRAAVEALPNGCAAIIHSDSEVVCSQLNGHYKVRDPILRELQHLVLKLVSEKELRITYRWIPRRKNAADKLL